MKRSDLVLAYELFRHFAGGWGVLDLIRVAGFRTEISTRELQRKKCTTTQHGRNICHCFSKSNFIWPNPEDSCLKQAGCCVCSLLYHVVLYETKQRLFP